MSRPFSPASARNGPAILAVLQEVFADRRHVLEVGSGTGQHAVQFAAAMPQLVWQCADVAENLPGIRQWLAEARLPNTPAPLAFDVNDTPPAGRFDAVFSANTLHIMGWPEVQRFFALLPGLLSADARLTVYGPFKVGGEFTGASNAAFDATLRSTDAKRGIRDLEAVDRLARGAGLVLRDDREMPANNRCVTWWRGP